MEKKKGTKTENLSTTQGPCDDTKVGDGRTLKMVDPSRSQFARHSLLPKKLGERSKGNLTCYPALLGLVNHLLYSYHLGCVLQAIPAMHLTWKVSGELPSKDYHKSRTVEIVEHSCIATPCYIETAWNKTILQNKVWFFFTKSPKASFWLLNTLDSNNSHVQDTSASSPKKTNCSCREHVVSH